MEAWDFNNTCIVDLVVSTFKLAIEVSDTFLSDSPKENILVLW